MKIKLIRPWNAFHEGTTLTLDPPVADELIRRGVAIEVKLMEAPPRDKSMSRDQVKRK